MIFLYYINLSCWFVFNVCLLFGKHDYWNVTSYSESLMLYHMSMFLLLLSLCIHYKYFMFGVINLINSFSFFIYLLHPIVLEYVYEYTSILLIQVLFLSSFLLLERWYLYWHWYYFT